MTIPKEVNWIQQAWRSVKDETFIGLKFAQDLDIDEFIDFDDQFDMSQPTIDPSEVEWREIADCSALLR